MTKRGRDYLKATIGLALISSVFDVKSLVALSFALALAALISFCLLASISLETTRLTVSPEKTRLFKGEEFMVKISVSYKRARWVFLNLSSVKLPEGVIVKRMPAGEKEGLITVIAKSPYSGLFNGMDLKLDLLDTLGLFSKEIHSEKSPFSLESLPLSILATPRAVRSLPLSVGERSARTRGSSLELYALDEYQPFSEPKNLLWKKIARMPDEKLIVRVREAMIPKVVKIGIVKSSKRGALDELRFNDLLMEGVGALCNKIIATGSSIEIIFPNSGSGWNLRTFSLSSIDDMIDAMMEFLSEGDENIEQALELVSQSDIVICGLWNLRQDETLARAISKKPVLLIEDEEGEKVLIGRETLLFSGTQDVNRLVSKVIER